MTSMVRVAQFVRAVALFAVAMGGVSLSALAAETIVVATGETKELGTTAAEQGGNGSVVYDLREGATLKFVKQVTQGSTIWNPVFATNGVATVDTSKSGYTRNLFDRGLRCGEAGGLKFIVAPNNTTLTFDDKAFVDARHIEFFSEEGEKISGKLYLGGNDNNGSAIAVAHVPTNSSWAFSPYVTDVHFVGPNVVAGDEAELLLTTVTRLSVGHAEAVTAGQTVRAVGDAVVCVRPFATTLKWDNTVVSYDYDQPQMTAGFVADLQGANSVLELGNVVWTGSVSGIGTVKILSFGATLAADVANAVVLEDGAVLTVAEDVVVSAVKVAAGAHAILKVLDGAHVTIVGSGSNLDIEKEGTAVVSFTDPGANWQNEVSWWFDPSHTDSLRFVGYYAEDAYKHPGATSPETGGYPIYEQILDWRHPEMENAYSLFNVRTYAGTDHYFGHGLYPCLVPYEGSETLMYLSCVPGGTKRRMPLGYNNDTTGNTSFKPKMVMMVFGGQGGGGKAVIGTTGGKFGRTGSPVNDITTNTEHDVWVDGVKIADPSAADTLKSGWQIITVDTDGLNVNGFGWCKDYDDAGGQNYAEILIFMNEVSEQTRLLAETYLADRWNLSAYSDAARARLQELLWANDNTVTFSGSGDYAVANRTLRATGRLQGTVTLENAQLVVAGKAVPTEKDVPTEGLDGWFDPDYRPSLHLFHDLFPARKDEPGYESTTIRVLADRRSDGLVAGDPVLVGVGNRMPYATVEVHGEGLERTWMDYRNLPNGDSAGNNLRVALYDSAWNLEGINSVDLSPFPTLTGFIVTDSIRGGGSPVQTAVSSVKGNDIFSRGITAKSSDPIWNSQSADKVKNGETRLNGETVDQTKGFGGTAEVLSFRPTVASSIAVMGCFSAGQGTYEETAANSFEHLGEMLFYSTALSDEQVRTVESYLMYKWLGLVYKGYHAFQDMTVAGSGTIVSPDAVSLPAVDSAFAGTVEVTGSAVFEITIDPETDVVTGGIIAPNAVLDLPDEVTLKVRFTSRPRRLDGRLWTLFDCAGTARPVTWKLQLEGEKLQSDLELQAEGGVVRLALPASGLMLLVR